MSPNYQGSRPWQFDEIMEIATVDNRKFPVGLIVFLAYYSLDCSKHLSNSALSGIARPVALLLLARAFRLLASDWSGNSAEGVHF